MNLVDELLAGDQRAASKLITMAENNTAEFHEIMKEISPYAGKSYIIGITGPPGAGKSTLIDKLIELLRNNSLSVGILAVDPTSCFSGGAVLGDRIRMQHHVQDKCVFIRSMATRGAYGGLPTSIRKAIRVLEALGMDFIIVETVGVGQTEVDVAQVVDTTVVVLVPESGDGVQAMKAGLMEAADIFVVNKADREGVYRLATELEVMLHINEKESWWEIPVVLTEAINNVGIDELYQKIKNRHQISLKTGQFSAKRQEQRMSELFQTIEQEIMNKFSDLILSHPRLIEYVKQVEKGKLDPYCVSHAILHDEALLKSWLMEII